MTKRLQIEVESVLLFMFAAGTGVVFAYYLGHTEQFPTKTPIPVIQAMQNTPPTPVITPILLVKPQITSQFSPDGSRLLTLTVITNKDQTKTYGFVISNGDGTAQQAIYTTTYANDTMSIPFNTWSPDNKYVFLTHKNSTGTEALVLRADGQPLTSAEQNFNLKTIFIANNTGNTYQETTGWASETLLIVNSIRPDGSKGPSYWIEIPSKAVIPLATQF